MTARIAGLGLAALMAAGATAVGQDIPSPRQDLPFSFDTAVPPGPARSMGEPAFGQLLPPSDRTDEFGAPRSMGELPTALPRQRPSVLGPLRPNLLGPDGLATPDILVPGQLTTPVPENLLLAPGFLNTTPLDQAELDRDRAALNLDEPLPEAPRIDDRPPATPLAWDMVRLSAETAFPPYLAILQERPNADGQVLASLGYFDLSLSADSRNYPLGYYDRTIQDFFATLPLRDAGGKFFSGYRIGTGLFPSYYQNLATRGGGAFVNGIELPLLRNREIDPARAKLYKAEIERRKVEPTIQKARITLLKDAAKSYFEWVASGHIYAVNQRLARTADIQFTAVEQQNQLGRLSDIDVTAFRSVVLKRKQQLIDSNRAYQARSIALSLYLRDPRGLPLIPDSPHLPAAVPPAKPPDDAEFLDDLATAIQLRPELRGAQFDLQKAQVDRELAGNQFLPSANFYVYTEQNVGDRNLQLGPDFRPFIMETSLLFEVPLQRRFARGQIRSADAQIRQAKAAIQFAGDTVKTDVEQVYSALRAAYDNLQLYRENEQITRRLEESERQRLRLGGSNILLLYIREQSSYDAQILRAAAEAKFFSAVADYRAALGLDALPRDLEAHPPAPAP